MPEEQQMLQTICGRAALQLSQGINNRCAVTLFAFYKAVLATGTAFASSLPDREAVALTIEATVSRSCGAPLPERDPEAWLPEEAELRALGEKCRELLPFSCGFVLIFGAGVDSSCTTFEEAEAMRGFLAHIALPQFKEKSA